MRPYIVTIVVILLLLSLFAYFVLWSTQDYEGFVNIDGDLGDWDGITRVADALGDTGNANIDMVENAFQIDTVYLSLLTTTAEPIFTSLEAHTLRVLIDSDANTLTGYALPGIGADYIIEVYGWSLNTLSTTGLTNETVLYSFDDSRDRHDWNGFTPLTALEARTDSSGTSVEMQVPLFDLGMSRSTDARLLWQTGDSMGNNDLGDNIVTLKSDHTALDSVVSDARQAANSQKTGSVISIDGQFDDWASISKQSDGSGDTGNPNIDLSEYATTQQSVLTCFYLKVEGNVLEGVAIPEPEARSRPSGDTIGPVQDSQDSGNQQSAPPLPVDASVDALRIFFDTDNNPFTGYQGLEVQMGADTMIEITGHFGIITQRVIKDYTGDGDDFTWGNDVKIDAAAAGSEIELEASISGSSDSYYIHLTSWNNDEDSAGSYQEDAKGGSRGGTVSWPSSWTTILTDANDDGIDAVDILSVKVGSDSTHLYFRIVTEAAVVIASSTFGILINDVSDTGQTYEAACHSRVAGSAKAYISQWSDSEWDRDTLGSDHIRVNSGGNGVDLACDYDSDTLGFTYLEGSDTFAAVSGDGDDDHFGGDWTVANPITISTSSVDDITSSTSIPEFSSLLMPIASVMLIAGYNYRSRRTSPLRT